MGLRHPAPCTSPVRQRGAALLLAMLTVALVATLASAALWQQFRSTEVEAAERQRAQASWVLWGALDWSRLILREDARSNANTGAGDHLGEPWAVALEEARLSSFLAADSGQANEGMLEAFLSGQVQDMQARLNWTNLLRAGSAEPSLSPPDVAAFERLFAALELTPQALSGALSAALAAAGPDGPGVRLRPQRFEQLAWLGLRPFELERLRPHVALLPVRTPLNLNTASPTVMAAALDGLDASTARRWEEAREREPFKALDAIATLSPELAGRLLPERFSVRSDFFVVQGRLRIDQTVVQERSLVQRQGLLTRILWRQRSSPAPGP